MVSPVCHTPSQSASIIHSNIAQLHAVTLHYDTPLTDSSRNIWCGLHFNQFLMKNDIKNSWNLYQFEEKKHLTTY